MDEAAVCVTAALPERSLEAPDGAEINTPRYDRKEAPPRRIVSLDQFRGYTVVGMLFVNFLGGFVVVPAVFKHHNTYCSYADTIMPQFFFAVGFAFRLTFLRRLATERRVAGRPRRSRSRAGAFRAWFRDLPPGRQRRSTGRS